MIKILLLDDQACVREGLRLLIEKEPDMKVIEEAADVSRALESPDEPDVVIADLVLPDKSGPSAISALSAKFSNSKVLVLTGVDSPVQVHLCHLAGARGYLLKEAPVQDLIEAIRAVNAGEVILDPSLGNGMATAFRGASKQAQKRFPYSLTTKELELVRLIALGHTNSEAAGMLKISLRTVEYRRAQILSRLGLKSRAELTKWAFNTGLTKLH